MSGNLTVYLVLYLVVDLPKKVPAPVAGYDRSPAPLPRDQRDKSDARRKELLVTDNSFNAVILLVLIKPIHVRKHGFNDVPLQSYKAPSSSHLPFLFLTH